MPNSSANLGGTQSWRRLWRAVGRSRRICHCRRCGRHGRGRHGRRLLPGAFYTLRETQAPPVEAFREHGVPMAVGHRLQPRLVADGSLLLAMNMACTLFRLTPEEALAGTTRNAARRSG
jgi:imidazolonepropionase-like amidohydrolase